jgi:hypothetical protein
VVSNAWRGGRRRGERSAGKQERGKQYVRGENREVEYRRENKTRQEIRATNSHSCNQEILNILFITVTYDHYSSY